MGVFFVLLLVPIMIQHIAIKGYHIDYQKRNKMALAFFFFLLTLLVMLRHETVGNDTTNYIYYFERYFYCKNLINATVFLNIYAVIVFIKRAPANADAPFYSIKD